MSSVDVQFKKGDFQSFRVRNRVHLGAFEIDLNPNDVVEFDGQVMKIGDDERSIPSLKSAIKRGWLVIDEGDDVTPMRPQSAGVTMRPAEMTKDNADQKGRRPSVVADDEREVGQIVKTDDGKEVRKLSSPKSKTVMTGSTNVASEINKIEQQVSRPRESAFDVNSNEGYAQQAGIAVAQYPRISKKAGEGSSPELTAEEKEQRKADAAARAASAREDRKAQIAKDQAAPAKPAKKTASTADDKLKLIQQIIPGFEWDFERSEGDRIQDALVQQDNQFVLNAILSIESSEVVKTIREAIAAQ